MSEDTTSWGLIRDAAGGDTLRRDAFVRRYEAAVRAWFLSRWRDGPLTSDVEDAVQEVFVDCFRDGGARGRAQPDRGGGFRAFLFGVAHKVALRHERRVARRREQTPSSGAFDALASSELSSSRAFDRAWAHAVVLRAMARFVATQREKGPRHERRVEILRQRFELDRPIRDIATALGLDAPLVHKEYARARQDFRSALVAEVRDMRPGEVFDAEAECVRILGLLRTTD